MKTTEFRAPSEFLDHAAHDLRQQVERHQSSAESEGYRQGSSDEDDEDDDDDDWTSNSNS